MPSDSQGFLSLRAPTGTPPVETGKVSIVLMRIGGLRPDRGKGNQIPAVTSAGTAADMDSDARLIGAEDEERSDQQLLPQPARDVYSTCRLWIIRSHDLS
jgi:hypothetical protein